MFKLSGTVEEEGGYQMRIEATFSKPMDSTSSEASDWRSLFADLCSNTAAAVNFNQGSALIGIDLTATNATPGYDWPSFSNMVITGLRKEFGAAQGDMFVWPQSIGNCNGISFNGPGSGQAILIKPNIYTPATPDGGEGWKKDRIGILGKWTTCSVDVSPDAETLISGLVADEAASLNHAFCGLTPA